MLYANLNDVHKVISGLQNSTLAINISFQGEAHKWTTFKSEGGYEWEGREPTGLDGIAIHYPIKATQVFTTRVLSLEDFHTLMTHTNRDGISKTYGMSFVYDDNFRFAAKLHAVMAEHYYDYFNHVKFANYESYAQGITKRFYFDLKSQSWLYG